MSIRQRFPGYFQLGIQGEQHAQTVTLGHKPRFLPTTLTLKFPNILLIGTFQFGQHQQLHVHFVERNSLCLRKGFNST